MADITMDKVKTYSPDNLFSFSCPIFGSKTEIRVCLHLKTVMWSGKKPEARKGCQACLTGGKCPIIPIMNDINRHGSDPYFSATPVHGALKEDHLKRIRNVSVMPQTMDRYDVSDAERAAIMAVSVFNAPLKGKADRDGKLVELDDVIEAQPRDHEKPSKRRQKLAEIAEEGTAGAPIDTTSAAIAGDMSAAISIATQEKVA